MKNFYSNNVFSKEMSYYPLVKEDFGSAFRFFENNNFQQNKNFENNKLLKREKDIQLNENAISENEEKLIYNSVENVENCLDNDNIPLPRVLRPTPRIGKVIVLHKDDEENNQENNNLLKNNEKSKSQVKCKCSKSRCLKLYCECFAKGKFCSDCNCKDCENTIENKNLIIANYGRENFRNESDLGSIQSEEKTHKTHKGCFCIKSNCLKKYCECFQTNSFCSALCRCLGCKNFKFPVSRNNYYLKDLFFKKGYTEHLSYKMENISIAIQNNRMADSYKDSNYYSIINQNHLNEVSVNNIDDEIIENFEEKYNGNENISSNNFNNLIIHKNILRRDLNKRKIRRKRIKFNEKRKRLNYYDRLFRHNNDSENKNFPPTNYSSIFIKKENEISDKSIFISPFENNNSEKGTQIKKIHKVKRISFKKQTSSIS